MSEFDPRRRVPRTDAVLADPRLVAAAGRLGRGPIKDAVGAALAACRAGEIAPAEVTDRAVAGLPRDAGSLRPVINASGVIVHTNLGRAPLSDAARAAVDRAAGATDVELDLATGRRGRRGAGAVGALVNAVPGAEAAHVVNNGAAALALAANALARDREVIIARGEMVEIGDGFRIPELLEAAGARLREVGTTNRVRLADYAAAVGPQTGFVIKIHPSNFVVDGFTSTVGLGELRTLGVPVVADIGSGLLTPYPRLPDEPDAATSLAAGADLVTASGDKLLGGPQAGLIIGQATLVERLRRHPLARALRVDKLTLAALEATLVGPVAPVPAALARTRDELTARAERIAAAIGEPARAIPSEAAVGGGGAPGVTLPSAAVALPEHLAEILRLGNPAVVGRVERSRLLLDLIAVDPADDESLITAARAAIGT
ncbi:L-seryl-tRNA(Ser) seleniumtransferase [Naumannella cuiyingiana]|uniref:L-seryl-tRNA(Sec) selenium transferase n=1 Tax=Naumannella cuiyingiana TaxID=1347891 RepID=A0A7Z0DAB2_9ACTN|nr:L-seryl-tRNA(Ser) seleniumtransferase [Naumannella cuiyingiana]